MAEKKCNSCARQHSEEWNLTKRLAKSNRRLFITLIVVIALWLSTLFALVVEKQGKSDLIGTCENVSCGELVLPQADNGIVQ